MLTAESHGQCGSGDEWITECDGMSCVAMSLVDRCRGE